MGLNSDPSNSKIQIQVVESNRLSVDSVYLNIKLPKDDACFSSRFKYYVSISGKTDPIESQSPIITIPKNKVFDKSDIPYHLDLMIQDLSPLNCKTGGKCYQKIFFSVPDVPYLNSSKNYFTIDLVNFNNCFVERAYIENDIIYIEQNRIHWEDIDFKKIE